VIARALALAIQLFSITGCALRGAGPLVPAGPRELPPLLDDLDLASLATAIERTVPVWERAGDAQSVAAARGLVAALEHETDASARRAIVGRLFQAVRVREPVLVTAYYEPELAARLKPDATFRHPLFRRPPDLVDVDPNAVDPTCRCGRLAGRLDGGRLVPYPSRAEIDAGALAGRRLELAWTDDPVALFLLHVQGSGRLRLADGRVVGVRYAGTNGRPYRSLAQTLVARGALPPGRATLPAIRAWLADHPAETASVLAENERYTFFRLADGPPVGSLGVALTPGRSIAADARLVPPGTVAYLRTPSFARFVVSQDSGTAIVGAHADVFLGAGADAEARAGRTSERGTLYLLRVTGVPRPPTRE